MRDLREIAGTVWNWARERDFRGFDPYDGLKSPLLGLLSFRVRVLRLIAVQSVRNCPLNLRRLLLIPPGHNPKGLALFLSGAGYLPEIADAASRQELQQILLSLASKPDGSPTFSKDRRIRQDITPEEVETCEPFGWGYDFPWQGRAFYQPAWFPTTVCSSFVLDSLETSGSEYYPAAATGVARFVSGSLNVYEDDTGICFSYSPRDHSKVFNASLFTAKTLVRAAEFDAANADAYRYRAEQACRYVVSRQSADGSWVYGEADHWQWVDSLHTGFVLEALGYLAGKLGTDEFDEAVSRGLAYYRQNLFETDWDAKYYSNRKYPLDPHSFAQGAITFMELARFSESPEEAARGILDRAVECLWDDRRRGFIFRRYSSHSNSTVFLRWSQGWMFKALCMYIGGNR
jgi:hypothetical protein